MSPQTSKLLIGACIAAALAFAVYSGLISQQTATSIQTQANQTLATGPANQQTTPANQQTGLAPQTPAQTGTAAPAPAPRP